MRLLSRRVFSVGFLRLVVSSSWSAYARSECLALGVHSKSAYEAGAPHPGLAPSLSLVSPSRPVGRLFDAHTPRLSRVAFSVLRNKEDAEDASHDGWCGVTRCRPGKPLSVFCYGTQAGRHSNLAGQTRPCRGSRHSRKCRQRIESDFLRLLPRCRRQSTLESVC